MDSEAFEWDGGKAARNIRDHGVTFEAAREVFRDAFAVEWTDDGHNGAEQRFVTLGSGEPSAVRLVYTSGTEDSDHLGQAGGIL